MNGAFAPDTQRRRIRGTAVAVVLALLVASLVAPSSSTVHADEHDDPLGFLDLDFTPDITRDDDLPPFVAAVLELDEGGFLVAGWFERVDGQDRPGVARLDGEGRLDGGFDPDLGPDPRVTAAAEQDDGGVLVGLERNAADGTFLGTDLLRLEPDGTVDEGFSPDIGGFGIETILVTGEGIYVGGVELRVDGEQRRLIRLAQDGTIDDGFAPQLEAVYDLAEAPGGGLLVATEGPGDEDGEVGFLHRVSTEGEVDVTFDPGTIDGWLSSVAVTSTGQIVIGGRFENVDGEPRSGVARLDADGTLDDGFVGPELVIPFGNQVVASLAVDDADRVLVAGRFVQADDVAVTGLVRLGDDGALDGRFIDPQVSPAQVSAITLLEDGDLLVGGSFGWVDQQERPGLARLTSGALFEVTASVSDTAGEPVAGVCLFADLRGDDGEVFFDDGRTDVDGTVTLRFANPQLGEAPQGSARFFDCDADRQEAQTAFVFEDQPVVFTATSAEPTVLEATAVRGAYVDVELRDVGGDELGSCSQVSGPLVPGETTLLIFPCSHDGVMYAEMYVGDTRNPEAAEVLDLEEGERISRTVTVLEQGNVAGGIVDVDAQAAPSSCVQVFERVDGVRGFASQRIFPDLEPAGSATFDLGVAQGDTVLEFAACEGGEGTTQDFPYRPQFFDGVAELDAATAITVQGGQTVEGIDVELSADAPLPGDGDPDPDPDPEPEPEPEPDPDPDPEPEPEPDPDPDPDPTPEFSDVDPELVHAPGIAFLVERGITTGFADGTFRPGEPVTRGQMASFLDRALGLDAAPASNFPDVDPGLVHAPAIDRLVGAAITTGFADGTFRPGEPVTRGQMATFLFRALGEG